MLTVGKRLAQNIPCKLKQKNGIFENHHLLHKICHHLLHKNYPRRAARSMAEDRLSDSFMDAADYFPAN
jgi:hypothetical protein